MALDDTELEFEPEALRAIAAQAERKYRCSWVAFDHREYHDGCHVQCPF